LSKLVLDPTLERMRKPSQSGHQIQTLVQEIEKVLTKFENLEKTIPKETLKSQTADLKKQLESIQSQIKLLS